VFITFKEIKLPGWSEAKRALDRFLKTTFLDVVSKAPDTNDVLVKSLLEDYTGGKVDSYEFTLRDLTLMLHRVYGKKAILLIDEYDVPIEAAHTYREKDPDYYEYMVALMRTLLTAALKGNEHLEFAVLTGVFRVAKESIFSGLNNLTVYTILDNWFQTRFGFTEEEVHQILKHYGFDTEEDKRVVREWYNGYIVGKVEGIHNPWSVINYSKERMSGKTPEEAADTYWINTSSNDVIIKQIENNPYLHDEIDRLISGDTIEVHLDPHLSLREIDENPDGVWTLLASGGYLKAKQTGPRMYEVSIPNREVMEFYRERVMRWLEKVLKVSGMRMMKALREVIIQGSVERFATMLKQYLENSISYFDVGYDDAERVYKAFVLGMMSMGMNGYMVETEIESGYGRVDVAVYPKDRKYGKYALLMEIKRAKNEADLEKAAKEALNQIDKNKYVSRYKRLGYDVVKIGIAFFRKKVVVLWKK
jgi:hypothetical protein